MCLLAFTYSCVCCSYSVEGGPASRLGQCAHAFVRAMFSKGCVSAWTQQKVRVESLQLLQ